MSFKPLGLEVTQPNPCTETPIMQIEAAQLAQAEWQSSKAAEQVRASVDRWDGTMFPVARHT